ncbi:fasciclin domain-containing protein [Dietzia sp. ANT_WB102]|uniref:fasciclin domain-containing protein n=1 Tax=Dietzia sp. ANT_WB102 TaxID=2597345 RepID=UPI0011F07A35|nr:fasciclin domain-containing protein [Dietzia sp. ANT_WB102]KAA0918574.1 fasciclin domain-containing protein [Dietzia sp. ANT_WB102]
MGITISRRMATIAAAAATTGLVLAGCSSNDGATDAESTTSPMTSSSSMMSSPTTASSDMMADPAAMLVGPGCADYAKANPDGAGSVNGMAQEPVATAASNNPLLTTLTKAVSGQVNPDVNLVDTLNNGEYTVFAPTDDAFAKVDQATMDKLSTDADLLTTVLTHHVVEGRINPDKIDGKHMTLAGDEIEVTGSGDNLMVGETGVVCGGVQTANATVYLVDSVLMPKM